MAPLRNIAVSRSIYLRAPWKVVNTVNRIIIGAPVRLPSADNNYAMENPPGYFPRGAKLREITVHVAF